MQIKLAETAGFCFGVNRAVKLVETLLDEGNKVYTLGPIIHNPQLVDSLAQRGTVIINSPDEAADDGIVVLRSHGVTKEVKDEIERLGLKCVDATCPFVEKIHKIIRENSTDDNIVFIAGDESHPEVQGIRSYAKGQSYVFRNADELEKLCSEAEISGEKEKIFVAQTTFNTNEWKKCKKNINLLYTNAKIFDTICIATEKRQKEAIELSKISDIMIVIGGRKSSNTAKLCAVCSENCRSHLIETAAELKDIDFTGVGFIGLTAGASTPDGIIKEVLKTMSEIQKENTELVNEELTDKCENVTEEVASQEPVADVAEEAPTKSFDEMTFEEALEASLRNMSSDQKVKGIVVGVTPTEVQVDIGRKQAGFVPYDEFTATPNVNLKEIVKIGDVLDLIIMRTNDQEGTMMLSKRRFDALKCWDDIAKAVEDNTVFEGVVTDIIRGGVLVATNDCVKVFVPASLATASRNDNIEDLKGKTVKFKIIEVNRQRKRAVGSIRATLSEERKKNRELFWANIQEGQTFTGMVKSITAYGAFVDLGGVDGMVHVSELSWNRIKHPSEVVKVGDYVEVTVKAIDREKKTVSLGYRKEADNPWAILKEKYQVGDVAKVKVVGMTAFGAFATLIEGIDGLIHISQITNRRIDKPQDVLSVGDEVEAKITEIDYDRKRVSLSIRALIEPVAEEAPAEDAAE